MKLNIVLGRFQPLHDEHVRLIQTAIDTSDRTLILVGCCEQDGSSKKNPFTFHERASILSEQFLGSDLIILPIEDELTNDMWLEQVNKQIKRIAGTDYTDISFILCNKDTSTTESNQLLTQLYPAFYINVEQHINATDIRSKFYDGNLKYITHIPQSTLNFLTQVETELQSICKQIIEKLTSAVYSVDTVLETLNISLTDWQLSYLYSYLDLRVVSCIQCDMYKDPESYACTSTESVYQQSMICEDCKE